MPITYALLALGLVVAALVGLASAVIGVGEWLRWLRGFGTAVVLVSALVTGGAALSTVVPRTCDGDGIPSVQRPLTAALDGQGRCHLEGVAQVALVPVVGVACSLSAVVAGRRDARRAAVGREVSPPTHRAIPLDAVQPLSTHMARTRPSRNV